MKELKIRQRGYRRIAALGSGGAALAITMLMLLAPLSAAVTVVIPVAKLGAQVSYSVNTGACAKGKILIAPHWTPAGGMFKGAGSATAPKCAPSPSINSAFVNEGVGLQTTIHFKSGNSHNITVAWKITMSSSWTVTPYTGCVLNYKVSYSTCTTYASAEIFGFAYLYDQTNSGYFNFGTYVDKYNTTSVQNYSNNYCYSGTCYHSGGNSTYGGPPGSFAGTWLGNSTIGAYNKSAGPCSQTSGDCTVNNVDTYALYVQLYIFISVGAYTQNAKGTGAASAMATVNLGTIGNGAQLTSVSYV